jgi:hypothetical protein
MGWYEGLVGASCEFGFGFVFLGWPENQIRKVPLTYRDFYMYFDKLIKS